MANYVGTTESSQAWTFESSHLELDSKNSPCFAVITSAWSITENCSGRSITVTLGGMSGSSYDCCGR